MEIGQLVPKICGYLYCAKHKISKWITDDSFITVVAVRSVLARHGANVREQTVPEVTVCLSL